MGTAMHWALAKYIIGSLVVYSEVCGTLEPLLSPSKNLRKSNKSTPRKQKGHTVCTKSNKGLKLSPQARTAKSVLLMHFESNEDFVNIDSHLLISKFQEFFVARGKGSIASWFWPSLYFSPWSVLKGVEFPDFHFRALLTFCAFYSRVSYNGYDWKRSLQKKLVQKNWTIAIPHIGLFSIIIKHSQLSTMFD